MQKSASVQPRTSLSKSGGDSIHFFNSLFIYHRRRRALLVGLLVVPRKILKAFFNPAASSGSRSAEPRSPSARTRRGSSPAPWTEPISSFVYQKGNFASCTALAIVSFVSGLRANQARSDAVGKIDSID